MKLWEIWSEGYECTGNRGTATLHAIVEAETFDAALDHYAAKTPEFAQYFRRTKDGIPLYWGCVLFDNKIQASQSFG